jgi:protein TonB
MSRLILSLVFISLSLFVSSQSTDEKVYTKEEVDSVAHFPNTEKDKNKWLAKTMNANTPVDNGAPEGTYVVRVKFIVMKDGTLKDFQVETSHGFGMEKEVLRVLKLSPKWVPATKNGSSVNSWTIYNQTFRITSE